MLELRNYTPAELAEIIGTSTDKQQIERKLKRYEISYSFMGWGKSGQYTIQAIPNRFRLYCVWELGIPPACDFTKLRNLFYYLFCVEGFADLTMSQMEAELSEVGVPVSRQTISKWLQYLAHIDFVMFDKDDCIYYKIVKKNGEKQHIEIDRETYCKAWTIYFESKPTMGSDGAYWAMNAFLGGHPYRKARMVQNVFYQKEVNRLIDYINETFLE